MSIHSFNGIHTELLLIVGMRYLLSKPIYILLNAFLNIEPKCLNLTMLFIIFIILYLFIIIELFIVLILLTNSLIVIIINWLIMIVLIDKYNIFDKISKALID